MATHPLTQAARSIFDVRPEFDRSSRYFYLIALGALALKITLYDLSGFTSSSKNPWDVLLFFAFPILPALMLRRVGHDRIATVIEATMLLLIAGLICVQLQFPITAHSPRLADDFLYRADSAIGFNWLSFSLMFQSPRAWKALEFCYGCFRPESALVIIYLSATGRIADVWKFLTAYIMALLFCVIAMYIFPATGSHVLCGLRPPQLPVSHSLCDYGPMIEALRNGSLRTINTDTWVGLASFPSFHVAAAALMQWHLRHSILRWPALPINIGMAIGAIVVGSHYFVDILAGLILAAICGFVSTKAVTSAAC